MAREKKPVHRVQMTEGKRNIIHQLLEEYDIQSAEDKPVDPFSLQKCMERFYTGVIPWICFL